MSVVASARPSLDRVPGLGDDAEGSRVVGEELRLLDTVFRALDDAGRVQASVASAAQGRALDDQRLLELREDVGVAKPEDLPALFEQMHHLAALRDQRGRSVSGSVDRASPYFGHLRLEENGRRRDVLIGSRQYVDSSSGIRIVDWRNAPVSRVYYRYGEGDDYEERFGERAVEGTVVARRGVTIAGGELVRVSAPQGTFVRGKDGAWKRVSVQRARLETESKRAARLGVGADGQLRHTLGFAGLTPDKHLPAIAALLDEKQFDLVAKESRGLVAIQGSAGSGKTTVGLHRVAYLAFAEPQRFQPDKMLVVVPNEALIHYVSRVLPSLGVEGVAVTTFARFAARLVAHAFPRLPTKISDETPPVVSRAKSHAAMLRGIDRLVDRLAQSVDARVRKAMDRWPEGARAIAAWDATARDARTPIDARAAMLGAWLSGKRHLPGAPPAATALPHVTRGALEQTLAHARGADTRSVAGVWDELLTSRAALVETLSGERGFGPGQIDQVHSWCVRQSRVRAEGDRDAEVPTLDAEDFALLLRVWQRLRGPLVDLAGKPIRFAHAFVDEVQDASPVELRVLLDLTGAERCITLAGDVAQRLHDDSDDRGEFDWNALLGDLGIVHTAIEPLEVSYRSTAEITEFARRVLGPLAHEEAPETTRHGPPVEMFTFASAGEAVAWMAEVLKQLARDEPEANVAVVARFPQQADTYYAGLSRAEVPNVRRVAKQDFAWEPGVDVTDVRQTKGLEFDEVLLVETSAASYPATPQARHALYVGATRASHQLWCIASGEPSPIVQEALPLVLAPS